MSTQLWAFDDLLRASGGVAEGLPAVPIAGVSIDTRTLAPGDVFVALKDTRDGHEFVGKAFAAGAAAAIVAGGYRAGPGDGALIRVADPLRALEAVGRAARNRLAATARVVAVTGSAGKTGTKEMLRACLQACGRTHASEKSYNNHWGVPLTLARMPADTEFAVLEIGMNHAGEIAVLVPMVRPHVAIVTTVEPVHLAAFPSVAAIAEAKAEIFGGLVPGGTAIVNRDNAHYEILAARAADAGCRVVSFGSHGNADVRPAAVEIEPEGSTIILHLGGREIVYRVGVPGAHIVQNSLAVAAAISVLGLDAETALAPLARITAPAGRGARTTLSAKGGDVLLIDESYNANPASMRAAFAALATVPRARFKRRIAVLGDMLELGAESGRLHAELAEAVDAAATDLVFACGPGMASLFERLPKHRRGVWGETSDAIEDALLAAVEAGDVVMIKGSLGSRMGPLATALKAHLRDAR